jgi:crotonobetainyl-CoA:carnitine CoA-transferase CaiB-like acyl-CoA transferase
MMVLDGLRVIDFGQYLAGPMVAMMLGDHGAEVIRVDPPDGVRWQTSANAVLQRGKTAIRLDFARNADVDAARRLITGADVVIENFRPGVMARCGLGAAEMTTLNPQLLYCSLPGFGHTDPRADQPGWEGIVNATTGLVAPSVREPGTEPSMSLLPVASTFAAFIGFNCILAALLERQRSGCGQRIEVPLHDAVFEAIGTLGQQLPTTPVNPIHAAAGGDFRASDGSWVHLVLIAPRHFRSFAQRYFASSWKARGLDDPALLLHRPDLAAEARERLGELIATKTAAQWRSDADALGIPLSITRTARQWMNEPQADAIRAVIDVADHELGATRQAGFPLTLHRTPAEVRFGRREPARDAGAVLAAASRPSTWLAQLRTARLECTDEPALAGVRVLDLTQVLAGPTAGRILAELGADVIKINDPHGWSIGHLYTNSGKHDLLLDISTAAGRDIALNVAARCDVVMQNFVRGTAERLGLGVRDVQAVNPQAIYASVSANTYAGPWGGQRGWEPLGQSPTGIMLRNGGGVPRFSKLMVCDFGTGHLYAAAILLGLLHRARTGQAQQVEASLVQTGTYLQLPFLVESSSCDPDQPTGPPGRGPRALDHLYRAADRWIYLRADADQLRDVAHTMDFSLTDYEDAALTMTLAARFGSANAAHWTERLGKAGIAAHVVCTIDEAMSSNTARARGLSVVRDHPGVGKVRSVGPGPRLSRTPARLTAPAAQPGARSAETLNALGWGHSWSELVRDEIVADRLIAPAFVAL